MLWGSSALSEFCTSLSKVQTLWHCVKVKQRYQCAMSMKCEFYVKWSHIFHYKFQFFNSYPLGIDISLWYWNETFKHCLQCARHFYYDQYLSSGWHLFLSPQSSSWSEHLCSYQLQLFLCLISSEFLLSLWYHSTPISHAKSPGISHCASCGFFSAHSRQNWIWKKMQFLSEVFVSNSKI